MKSVLFCLIFVMAVLNIVASDNVWSYLGPDGGEVSVLAIDPQNPANIYAASTYGRLFKSSNGGDTWSAADSGFVRTALPAVLHGKRLPGGPV